jgi:hypothetical protein
MKMTVKAKSHKPKHNLQHARISFAKNGGATVHTRENPSEGKPYPDEQESGAFNSPEEALHHVGKMVGADVVLGDPDADAAEDMAKRGAGNGQG